MPQLVFSTAFTANQLGVNPLSGWQYEFLAWPAHLILLRRSTDVNLRATIYSGSETIQERSHVQGGGTAGTTPSDLNTPTVSWIGADGDRLKDLINNVSEETRTLD